MPVVEVEDVDRPAVGAERLERGPAEQPEPPGVVGVVAGGVAVEPLAVEGRRVVDQAQPVAVGRDVDDGHRAVARRRARIRDAQRGRTASTFVGLGHAPVARQEDVDRRLERIAAQLRRAPGPGRRPRRPGRRSWPTARIRRRASTTRIGMAGIVRAARTARRPPPATRSAGGTKPVHAQDPTGVSCAPHGPRPRPVDPGGQLPPAAPARRPPAPRLQPPLGLAPADPRPVQPRSTARPWTRYRNPIPVISGPTEWSRLLDDAKFLAEYHDVLAEFDGYMANGAGHWFQRRYADQLTGPIAYFCAEYGFHESLGIYSGGLGRPGRRPHEVGQRHGPAGDRRRAPLSQGLLPPDDRRRRPPGARLPRLRPDPPAARARPGRRRACR